MTGEIWPLIPVLVNMRTKTSWRFFFLMSKDMWNETYQIMRVFNQITQQWCAHIIVSACSASCTLFTGINLYLNLTAFSARMHIISCLLKACRDNCRHLWTCFHQDVFTLNWTISTKETEGSRMSENKPWFVCVPTPVTQPGWIELKVTEGQAEQTQLSHRD